MKVVGYLRVSLDDKGQDPDRQRAPIESRAARDGHQVVGWVTDKGTSGSIPAMTRPRVIEAVRLAKAEGAGGIMVESVDRWTRDGPRDLALSMFELEHDHRLQLVVADINGDDFTTELLMGIMATIAKMVRRRLIEATKSGIANARRKGVIIGRPRKPDLTDEELAACVRVGDASLPGLRRMALIVSQMRGAHEVADAKARRFRTVSRSWLADQLAKRPESPGLLGRVVRPSHDRPSRNGPLPEQPAEQPSWQTYPRATEPFVEPDPPAVRRKQFMDALDAAEEAAP